MRKDVKLGLAVGGVLLAVLVVYVLVVPGNNGNQQGADVALSEGSETTGGSASGGATAQGNTGASDSTASTDHDATASAAKHDTPSKPGEPASAGGTPKPDAGATAGATGTKTDTNANTGATTSDKSTESAGGGWNWDALVNGTEKVPSLGASTDVATRQNTASGANDVTTNALQQADTTGTGGSQIASHRTSGSQTATGSGQHGADTSGTAGQQTAQQTSSGAARSHVVKPGETYSKIAAAEYGASKYYLQIEAANPNIDPTRLKPGMTINLPAIDTAKTGATAAAAPTEKAVDPKSEYKVQPGDKLYTISMRLYGKPDRVEKIYELNKATIGDDMARLKVGMVLKLPEAPTQTAAATQ